MAARKKGSKRSGRAGRKPARGARAGRSASKKATPKRRAAKRPARRPAAKRSRPQAAAARPAGGAARRSAKRAPAARRAKPARAARRAKPARAPRRSAPAAPPRASAPAPGTPASDRVALARRVLALAPRLELAVRHADGRADATTALRNVEDTAAGGRATRGSPVGVAAGPVELEPRMLGALVALVERGYRLRVAELAGGCHRADSAHYAGAAFRVDRLNGQAVGPRHPDVGRFRDDCRRLGALRVAGPGEGGAEPFVAAQWRSSPPS